MIVHKRYCLIVRPLDILARNIANKWDKELVCILIQEKREKTLLREEKYSLPVNGVKATHHPHMKIVQLSIQFLGPSGLSKLSGTNRFLSSWPWEGPSCSNASVCQDSWMNLARYTPIDWTYKFNRYEVLSRDKSTTNMKRLIKKAASESLLIPFPTPETVEIVAIVVMHQIPTTWKKFW